VPQRSRSTLKRLHDIAREKISIIIRQMRSDREPIAANMGLSTITGFLRIFRSDNPPRALLFSMR